MPGPHDSLNRPRRELLDQVVRRGERLRVQRRSFLAMAATSVVLLAIALPLALTAGSGENVQTVGAPVTTTTRARPRVRVYHQATSTTKPESAPAKPGERRKATPNPTVAGKSVARPAAPRTTAKPGGPPTTAKRAPAAEPSPVPQGSEQTSACTGTQPLATTGRGRIAFVRGGQIYTSEPDGTQEKQLSPEGENLDADPAWSPTGRRLVFVRAGTVYVMDATTGAVEFPLTDPGAGAASDPAWSPDGKKIAFSRGGDIWVVNAEPSSIPRAVTNLAGNESSPTWSPTSCKIAFAASEGPYGVIYTILDSGKELTKIIDGSAPSWSLSGTLAFELGPDVWVYTASGPTPRASGRQPSWSASGAELAFENQEAIYRVKNVDNEPPYPESISGINPAW